MDGSIDRRSLLRLTLKLVGEIAKRAEETIRPHSVAAGKGTGERYMLDGTPRQLSRKAPPEMELVAMTLQAFECWEAAIALEDLVTASAAALALGCSLQESQLVTSIQRTTGQLIAAARNIREGNRRGGSRGKWTDACDRIAVDVYERLRLNLKVSEAKICRQIAVAIQQDKELGIKIGDHAVKTHLRLLIKQGKAQPRPDKSARK